MDYLQVLGAAASAIESHWSPFELRLLVIEACAALIALSLALWQPQFAASARRRTWNVFGRLARRRVAAILLCAGLVFVLRLGLLPRRGAPVPEVHDEFSYLLGADTFASGRLTNPSHPLWRHFETFHVNQVPSYASIYPPAQAAILAAGKVIFGHPWAGVVLTSGALAAAVCWMLQAWMPPAWALLGGILIALRLGTCGYWVDSYWGGNAAALGGALVLGALPRIRLNPSLPHAARMGAGIFILANSRPFEGGVLCLPVIVALVAWRPNTISGRPRWIRRVVAPLALMVGLGAAVTCAYFWRVTGNPFVMPHQLNQKMYAAGSPFVWQPAPVPPVYRHASMARLYREWGEEYNRARSLSGFARRLAGKTLTFAAFFTSPVLWIPLLALPLIARRRKLRVLIWVCGTQALAVIGAVHFRTHYVAPAVASFCALGLTGLRCLRFWRVRERPTGVFLSDALLLICVGVLVARTVASPPAEPSWATERAKLARSLHSSGARHLIIVRYSEDHWPHDEWVYNAAAIDLSPVVWARDMGRAENRELVEYFKDRRVWMLEPDQRPIKLAPYDFSAGDWRPN